MADTVIRPNGKWQGGCKTVATKPLECGYHLFVSSAPFKPLYRARVLPTDHDATNLSVGRPTTDTRALRLEFESPVSAHARGFQRNSPLSVHRSIDASFAKRQRCLLQVARNFNWSGGIDRSANPRT